MTTRLPDRRAASISRGAVADSWGREKTSVSKRAKDKCVEARQVELRCTPRDSRQPAERCQPGNRHAQTNAV